MTETCVPPIWRGDVPVDVLGRDHASAPTCRDFRRSRGEHRHRPTTRMVLILSPASIVDVSTDGKTSPLSSTATASARRRGGSRCSRSSRASATTSPRRRSGAGCESATHVTGLATVYRTLALLTRPESSTSFRTTAASSATASAARDTTITSSRALPSRCRDRALRSRRLGEQGRETSWLHLDRPSRRDHRPLRRLPLGVRSLHAQRRTAHRGSGGRRLRCRRAHGHDDDHERP